MLTPNPTAGFVTKFDVDLTQVRYTQLLGLVVSGSALRGTTSATPQIYTGATPAAMNSTTKTRLISATYTLAPIVEAEDEGDTVDTTVGRARCPEAMMGCSKYFHESAAYAHAMRDASAAEV